METARHHEVRELFLQAVQLAPELREAYLEHKCARDPEMKREVQTLLSFHDSRSLFPSHAPDTQVAIHDGTAEIPRSSRFRPFDFSRIYYQRRKRIMTIGVVLVALLSLLVWAQLGVRSSTREVLETQLQIILSQQAFMIKTWLSDRENEFESWARTSGVQQAVKDLVALNPNHLDTAPAQKVLQQEIEALAGVSFPDVRYAVWNRERILVADGSQDPAAIGLPASEAGAIRLSHVFQGRTAVWLPSKNKFMSEGYPLTDLPYKPGIAMVVPVRDGEVVIAALLIGGIGLQDRFEGILSKARGGRTGETYAFDRDGYFLSECRFKSQLVKMGLLETDTSDTALVVRVADPGGDVSRGYVPNKDRERWPLTTMARSAIEILANRPSTNLVTDPLEIPVETNLAGYRDYRGISVVGAWTWLPEYGFGIATEVDFDRAYQATSYLRRVLYGALTFLIFSLVGTGLLWWRLAKAKQADSMVVTVGPYRLGELIGEGGMGRVFKAEHQLLKRPTAIKVIKTEVISASSERRFRREVQLASHLKSPHTIEIYDYGQSDTGFFYYAMEYLEGVTVSQLISRGRLTPARTAYMLRQVCRSLEEAHGFGLVHRDIKPQNLMVCDRGGFADFVVVLDFGLAKSIDPDNISANSTAAVVGTPEYISPERVRDPQNLDPRGDLYAVGAVGYCMLTGGHLFQAKSNLEILDSVLHTPIETIEERLGRHVHPELEAVIQQCLTKDPTGRPASARDLRMSLEAMHFSDPWTEAEARIWWDEFASVRHATAEQHQDAYP